MNRLLPLFLLFLAAACGPDASTGDSLTREQFIEINVALRQLEGPHVATFHHPEEEPDGDDSQVESTGEEGADGTEAELGTARRSGNGRPGMSLEDRRAAVLEAYGASDEQLRAFISEGSHTPRQLQEIWDEVGRRLERTPTLEGRVAGDDLPTGVDPD
jgi:hypothetical protein